MGVYAHPHQPKIQLAYTFFGTRLLTPKWFDDNDASLIVRHHRIGKLVFYAWCWCRGKNVVQMRYWGRTP